MIKVFYSQQAGNFHPDGFAAAWIIQNYYKKQGEKTLLFPIAHPLIEEGRGWEQALFANTKDNIVYCIDLPLSAVALQRLSQNNTKIIVFDLKERIFSKDICDLEKVITARNIIVAPNYEQKSLTSIVYTHFYGKKARPYFVKRIIRYEKNFLRIGFLQHSTTFLYKRQQIKFYNVLANLPRYDGDKLLAMIVAIQDEVEEEYSRLIEDLSQDTEVMMMQIPSSAGRLDLHYVKVVNNCPRHLAFPVLEAIAAEPEEKVNLYAVCVQLPNQKFHVVVKSTGGLSAIKVSQQHCPTAWGGDSICCFNTKHYPFLK